VSLNLRWPTARETSGPWLRALAAARPTIITDLVHLDDVPSLDPRTWRVNCVGMRDPVSGIRERGGAAPLTTHPACGLPDPICIAVDILDEDHSLRLAMRRLATDPALRQRLGQAAQAWWRREHSLEVMAGDYERVIAHARARPAPSVDLPPHLHDTAAARLHALAAPFGITDALSRDGFLE
jgi:hypothetical protein